MTQQERQDFAVLEKVEALHINDADLASIAPEGMTADGVRETLKRLRRRKMIYLSRHGERLDIGIMKAGREELEWWRARA